MDEEDIAKVRPESTRVIDLVQFTDAAAIDPDLRRASRTTSRPTARWRMEAFAVMREGMKGKAGIGKLALYGREYLVAVQPKDKGLVMYTLRHANEVRSMDNIEELDNVPAKVKPDEIKLAKQVIGNFEGALDLTEYRDEYQEELQRIIDAKIAGEEVVATAGRSAAEGRQPDGRAAPEPRSRQHRQEESRQGGFRKAGKSRRGTQAPRARLGRSRLQPRLSARALNSARGISRRSVRGPTAAVDPLPQAIIMGLPAPRTSIHHCPGGRLPAARTASTNPLPDLSAPSALSAQCRPDSFPCC